MTKKVAVIGGGIVGCITSFFLIKKGYEVLKKIADVLDGKAKGDLYELSSDFFTVIPHDFGFK